MKKRIIGVLSASALLVILSLSMLAQQNPLKDVTKKEESQKALPHPILGPAEGAELVNYENLVNFMFKVRDEFCEKMGADYYSPESVGDPDRRLNLVRSRFVGLSPKGEFETSVEYQERVKKWQQEADAAIKAYTNSFKKKRYSTYFPPSLGPYDADRGVFEGISFWYNQGLFYAPSLDQPREISVPNEKAKVWREREKQIKIRVDFFIDPYCGPGRKDLSIRISRWTLVYADTGEIIWTQENPNKY